MKQMKNKTKILSLTALGVFGLGTIIAIFGLSNTIGDIKEVSVAKTPDAILASAGVNEEELVSLPVLYYDQRADECVNVYDANLRSQLHARQFEWTSCEYYNKALEQGLVEFELNEKYMPVAKKGNLTSNQGIDFSRWFGAVEGKSASYASTLKMRYSADGAKFVYESEDFYPLDEVEFSNGDFTNRDKHNHLFTMNFAVPFTVLKSGEEKFTIKADDDTFVFIGNQLVIDMGGIHGATTGEFVIHEDGEVYAGVNGEDLAFTGVNLGESKSSIVRIFHADRNSEDSIFNIEFSGMNLAVVNTKLASGDGEGVQIAYDPSDPTYVAPLGETSIFRPDSTKGLLVLATIEGIAILVASILVVFAARFALRQKK